MTNEQGLDYLKELLKTDSVEAPAKDGFPFGEGVAKCLDKALDILKKYGFRTKNGGYYYGYGEIGEGDLFGILTHLDVVPVGKGWTKDPFGATEQDGKIYARGALDDKSPFIACLIAVTKLLDEGFIPTKRVRFILGCDEESGWQCMDAYQKHEEMPALGISPDGDFPVINCEKGIVYHSFEYTKPDNMVYLKAGERANMVPDEAEAKIKICDGVKQLLDGKDCSVEIDGEYALIKTKGVASHGSHPEGGVNALIKLLKILAPISTVCAEVSKAFSAYDGGNVPGLKISDEQSGSLTLNLGTAKTENGKIVFELDVRHPVTYKKEYVTEKLKAALTGKVTETFFHLPLYVDKNHVLVKTLLNAYNKVTGENAEPVAIGGGTYARVLPVGVAFGPCFPGGNSGMHCADEYVDINEFNKSVDIYYEALKELCFKK